MPVKSFVYCVGIECRHMVSSIAAGYHPASPPSKGGRGVSPFTFHFPPPVLPWRSEHPFDDFLRVVFEVQASVFAAHEDEAVRIEFHFGSYFGGCLLVLELSARRY